MKKPKFKRGDGVIIPDLNDVGIIIEEPEWEETEWTYSVRLNKDDGWGWFGESELKTYDDVLKDIEAQD